MDEDKKFRYRTSKWAEVVASFMPPDPPLLQMPVLTVDEEKLNERDKGRVFGFVGFVLQVKNCHNIGHVN